MEQFNKTRNFIEVEYSQSYTTIWLNRPDVHNAFHPGMLEELNDFFQDSEGDKQHDIVVLRGRGASFCAGADLQWMAKGKDMSWEQNVRECWLFAKCLLSIRQSGWIVIAVAHGAVYGGGLGLLSACDMAFCTPETEFSLSELRLGMVAAVISPFLYRRLGDIRVRELMFTARRFKGDEALNYGVVSRLINQEALDDEISEVVKDISVLAPKARFGAKQLLNGFSLDAFDEDEFMRLAEILAKYRISDEGREGMAAFLEKREPLWRKNPEDKEHFN